MCEQNSNTSFALVMGGFSSAFEKDTWDWFGILKWSVFGDVFISELPST